MAITVGVLRGGPSSEYEVSLSSGQAVIDHLPSKYRPVDVLISRQGLWQMDGQAYDPQKLLPRFDVVFNALHGQYGEDGEVQGLLRNSLFTGCDRLAAALSINKIMTKESISSHGLDVQLPKHQILKETDDIDSVVAQALSWISLPVVVKPNMAGSSVGVSIVKEMAEMESAIRAGFEHSRTVLIEEYIVGREASCGVVDGLRGQETYALPPVEIITPSEASFFDYSSKYSGQSEEVCPGRFGADEKAVMQQVAVEVHRHLGLRHYSRSDFIVHPSLGVFFLEVNSLPGITPNSILPLSLSTIGVPLSEFIDHVLTLALNGR